jgi:hypothetical protein
MSLLARLHNFVGGTPAIADEVDEDFDQLVNALNGTSTGKNLVTRYSNATEAPYAFDQLGVGLISEWRQSGATKAKVNNNGSFETIQQFISTVVTGTAPLVVASTTKVTNLNADLLDGLDQSNFVRDPGGNGLVSRTGAGSAVARTITGTANQINVSNGDGVSGNPTLSTPQNIDTGASPTFANLTTSSNLQVNGTTTTNGGVTIGSGGTLIKKVVVSSVTIDPPSIASFASGSATFTITGAAVGDWVLMEPPTAIDARLVVEQSVVTSADTVTMKLFNGSINTTDAPSQTWRYMWFDLT